MASPNGHGEILTTHDRARWRALVAASPGRDAFFLPEYALLFEHLSAGEETARLFFWGDGDDYIVYPFFVRPVHHLPFVRAAPPGEISPCYDAISPYGYSGPLACIRHSERATDLWRGFLRAFHHYCRETGIVCEFARLHPFNGNHVYLQQLTGGVRAANPIVYVALDQPEAALWRGFNRGNRSNINKARRNGVRIVRDADGAHVEAFYALYRATMRRNHADPWYDFSPRFFAESFALLGDSISLFYAEYRGRIVAAASFLHTGEVVHYFLGGSDSDYLALRPNNLLMYEAIRWAREAGFRFFNLGGGYGSGTSLLRFKAGFSDTTTLFYTYRKVHLPDVYDALCRCAAAAHPGGEEAWAAGAGDFFPLYRARGMERAAAFSPAQNLSRAGEGR